MLPLEPCYSAAHFKRSQSFVLEKIRPERASRNNSAGGLFTVFPLGQLQYSTQADKTDCMTHGVMYRKGAYEP